MKHIAKDMGLSEVHRNVFIVGLITVFIAKESYTQRMARCSGGAQCIALEDCSGLYNQLQLGNSPQLTRLLRSLHCGFQYGNRPMICCPPDSLFSRGSSSQGMVTSQSDATNLLPDQETCGIQSNDRIVGGSQADLDEHPWMALLRYDKQRGWGFYCGGVLISSRYVMTAAHCVKGSDLPKSWRLTQVRLGEWDTSRDRDCLAGDCSDPVKDVAIEKIIPHEGYNPADSQQYNDISLLRLAQNIRFTDFIKPICLPIANALRTAEFEGYDMEVAGWGKTENRSESEVKLKVRVPIVDNRQCNEVFNKVGRMITTKQLCAGGRVGKDSCRGDSGGSLMGRVPPSDNWLAIGIVSYGPSPCGTRGWPGVYTRVGSYVNWIISKLEP